jgi:nicotinate dehydrogenase subunit A
MVSIAVNGRRREIDIPGDTPLLYVLRNDLELNGPRFGCGLGQCGSCMVLVGGQPVRSCVMPVSAVAGQEVVTLEGLGTLEAPHPLQRAFIQEQAAQCGYCTSGMIMSAKALLDAKPKPTDAEIRAALDGHLCRCGSHNRVVRAVRRAAEQGA